ncbi:MAG: hypothetical protein ABL876_03000 [Chitinophagaceae bacterium]
MKHTINLSAVLVLFLLLTSSAKTYGQKVTQLKELPETKLHITQEIEKQIVNTVKPVRDQVEKLMKEDQSGDFAAYSAAMEKAGNTKDFKQQTAQLKQIEKKFYPFVKRIWDMAKVDEASYKQKLKNLFPNNVKETIRFGEFLNFTMSSGSQKPAPPPAPPPAPANICVDANALFRGTFGTGGGAIGGTRVQVAPANPPSPAEIVASATTAVLGNYASQGWIHNTVSLPGTFPLDTRQLRSKKTFDWNGRGTAFTIIGCAWVTVAFTTDANSSDFSVGGEMHTAVAPVTFINGIDKAVSRTEESLIPKTDLKSAQFGITCFVNAKASLFLSFSTATSNCAMWRWEICEE